MTDAKVEVSGVVEVGIFIVAIALLIGARELPSGETGAPGSGFFPFLTGFFLLMLSLYEIFTNKPNVDLNLGDLSYNNSIAIGLLLSYLGGIYVLGFYSSTMIFLVFSIKLGSGNTTLRDLIVVAITVGCIFVLFELILGVSLPKPAVDVLTSV